VKLLARLLGIAGAALVAWMLLGDGPNDLAALPDAHGLEVEVVRDGRVLRRAEFRLAAGERRVTQTLKLSEGEYLLRGRVERPPGPTPWERPLEVREDGTVVLALGR
jgi:hypothetical protein